MSTQERQPDIVDDDYEELEASHIENPDSEQQLGENHLLFSLLDTRTNVTPKPGRKRSYRQVQHYPGRWSAPCEAAGV